MFFVPYSCLKNWKKKKKLYLCEQSDVQIPLRVHFWRPAPCKEIRRILSNLVTRLSAAWLLFGCFLSSTETQWQPPNKEIPVGSKNLLSHDDATAFWPKHFFWVQSWFSLESRTGALAVMQRGKMRVRLLTKQVSGDNSGPIRRRFSIIIRGKDFIGACLWKVQWCWWNSNA